MNNISNNPTKDKIVPKKPRKRNIAKARAQYIVKTTIVLSKYRSCLCKRYLKPIPDDFVYPNVKEELITEEDKQRWQKFVEEALAQNEKTRA